MEQTNENESKKEKKLYKSEIGVALILLLLMGAMVFMGYHTINIEKKYVDAAIKYNNCSKNLAKYTLKYPPILEEYTLPEGVSGFKNIISTGNIGQS